MNHVKREYILRSFSLFQCVSVNFTFLPRMYLLFKRIALCFFYWGSHKLTIHSLPQYIWWVSHADGAFCSLQKFECVCFIKGKHEAHFLIRKAFYEKINTCCVERDRENTNDFFWGSGVCVFRSHFCDSPDSSCLYHASGRIAPPKTP